MEVFRPELHSFFIRPIIDSCREVLGSAETDHILMQLGVRETDLRDFTAWVSLEFVEALLERVAAERDDPVLMEKMFRAAITPRYLGPLYPLLRSFGSPAFTYAQVTKGTARFNKIGEWRVLSARDRHCELSYSTLPEAAAERSPLLCTGRIAHMRAVPTLFDLPPATVDHPQCMVRGDASCVYRIHWREPGRRFIARAGLLLGGSGGAAVMLTAETGALLSATLIGAMAVAGWALGRTRELRRDLGERVHEITEHHDALTRITRDNERRYAELLESKAEVDEKVRRRTQELHETSEQLRATLDELTHVSRAKDDFFANVSHELRTPLTLILSPLEDLVTGKIPAGGREKSFEAMHRSASRLLHLINQLLDLAKIDAGAMKASRAPTDILQLVQNVATTFEPAANKIGKELSVDAPTRLHPMSLDAGWVESAVTNLVANALRHAESKVHLRLQDHGDEVRIEVEDDGTGMGPADVERVFERFAQGSASEGQGGTGLGLAIVREAARLHGGEASVVSRDGSGTTFTITLPRAFPGEEASAQRPAPPPTARSLPLVLPDAAPSEDRLGPGPDAPLALVVEDNDDLREYIADVLGARYRVRTASDGRTGLELALELRPQVIVSDVSMPDLDGLEMTAELRKRDETRGTPVILVTARRSVSSVLEGFEVGADDYVSKPFHGRELLARVDAHVRLRQLVREMAHRERLATLGVVAASVAHQVRNPLTVLMSGIPSVQRRLADKVDPATAEMFEVMGGCARRIERMTVDLLDLSRIDREEQGVFRPGEGLASAVRLVAAGVPSGVQVETEIDSTAAMRGRAGDLNHVFLNLVDNACRAVGDEGTVRVRGALEDDEYVVRVEDTGPGVPEGRRARIFEPFFTTREAGEGTGLGLSIAKQVVDQHGGRIELDTSALGGALFTVRLPGASSDNCVVPYDARSLPTAHRP